MPTLQFTRRKNTHTPRQRAERAAACAVVRQVWELVLLQNPVKAQAVRTAERFVRGEADEAELEAARDAAAERGTWWPHRLINLGGLDTASALAVRFACSNTCCESAEDGLRQILFSISTALAARDVHGSASQRVLSELLGMKRRGEAWKRLLRIAWDDVQEEVEMRRRIYEHHLTAMANARVAAGDLTIQPARQPIPLPDADSVLLFGWGIPMTFGAMRWLTLEEPDRLLALAVRNLTLDRLWQACPRKDWRKWLEQVARTHSVISTEAVDGNPFLISRRNHTALRERRQQVWYALDPEAERLHVGAVWCLFGERPATVVGGRE